MPNKRTHCVGVSMCGHERTLPVKHTYKQRYNGYSPIGCALSTTKEWLLRTHILFWSSLFLMPLSLIVVPTVCRTGTRKPSRASMECTRYDATSVCCWHPGTVPTRALSIRHHFVGREETRHCRYHPTVPSTQ